MKRIITVGLILILFNQYAIAINTNEAYSLVSQFTGTKVELQSIINALADLNLTMNSNNINEIIDNTSFYVNFGQCQANILFLYLKIAKEKRKNISPYLYNDLFKMKPLFEQKKKTFLSIYSKLKNKSVLQLTDKIKIKINETETLYEKLLDIYRFK